MLILDISVCFLVFFLGFNLKYLFDGFTKRDKKILTQLFFWHLAITIAFHIYATQYGTDGIMYWFDPKKMQFKDVFARVTEGSATGVMYLINYFPSNILKLSFFTGNFIYGFLGYAGFVFLYKIFVEVFQGTEKLMTIKILRFKVFPLILFLSNFHFWSAGISKDALLFLGIMMFFYSIRKPKKRFVLFLISICISLAIRPHILLFLLVAYGLASLIDGKLKMYQKLLIASVFIIGFISIFSYVLQFIKLENLEFSSIEQYTSRKSSLLARGDVDSAVDTSNYPLPLKIFTFLYRPFFFDAQGVLGILASIENLILIIFTSVLFINKPIKGLLKTSYHIKAMFIYFFIGTLAFSLILGNLGIMLRQKNMLIPLFLIVGFQILINNKRIWA
mgnify:CR=1 FL=1